MRVLRRFLRRIRILINNLLVGDQNWASFRFFVWALAILAFFYLASFSLDREIVDRTVADINANGIWGLLPHRIQQAMAPFFHWRTLRYLIAPVGGSLFAIMIGALYVQDIYELHKYRTALRFLLASMFGVSYPGLEIRDGIKQIPVGEENLLDKVGGPGWVIIRPGNAVLFERLTNPTAVLAEGVHFVPRFERIKEIVDLKDQHGYLDEIHAVTKDGVVVHARDIHYIYRIAAGRRHGGEPGRTPEHPYPFSIKAVRNVAYGRSVSGRGVTPWADIVRIIFEGEIQNYIRRRQLDQITSPQMAGIDPRSEIHQLYNNAGLRRRFFDVGAELLWYGIGHLDVDEAFINDQRVQTWQAGWRGDAAVITAYGEALKKVYIEQGRAEAQAEILLAIIQALRDAGVQSGEPNNLQKIFLLRVAQLLEAMNETRLTDQV